MIQWNMQAPNYSLCVFSGFNWIALVVLLRVSMAEILSLFPDNPWGLLQRGMIICIIWGLEKEKEGRTSVPAAGLWLWAIHIARHNALSSVRIYSERSSVMSSTWEMCEIAVVIQILIVQKKLVIRLNKPAVLETWHKFFK